MEQTIISYIQEQLQGGNGDETIAPEDDLLGSGIVDSMGMMKLIGFIETEFKLAVPPQDMTIENFMTVAAIAKYVEQKQ
ncbi:MAG: acyl carrier protein [Bacteroidota bacterium]